MDKKGHIYISKLITNVLEENDIYLKQNYRLASAIGNIFPDIRPSFLKIKHNMEETYLFLEEKMLEITNSLKNVNRTFMFKLGEIIHYICDYFIYPHNPEIWEGSLIQHIKYEQLQHKYEYRYIKEKKYLKDFYMFEIDNSLNINQVSDKIKKYHKYYLQEERTIYTDCKYITCIILSVLKWFFNKLFNINLKIA